MSIWGTVYELERNKAIGNDPVSLRAEIERLKAVIRINGLRWGHTHAEIDTIINQQE